MEEYKVKWGIHFSKSKYNGNINKLDDYINIAIKKGWTCIQIFLGNPKSCLHRKTTTEDEMIKCKILCDQYNIQFYTHFPYTQSLVKLCSISDLSGLQSEMNSISLIKGRVVIHPNSPTDKTAPKNNIVKLYKEDPVMYNDKYNKWINMCDTAADVLMINLKKMKYPHDDYPLLLENCAMEGQKYLSTFEQLEIIGKRLEELPKGSVGFCIDTCHTFAAGLCTFESEIVVDEFFEKLKNINVLHLIKLIHLNDSCDDYWSMKDNHQSLCFGKIWNEQKLDGLTRLAYHCKLNKIDIICETGCDSDQQICKELF